VRGAGGSLVTTKGFKNAGDGIKENEKGGTCPLCLGEEDRADQTWICCKARGGGSGGNIRKGPKARGGKGLAHVCETGGATNPYTTEASEIKQWVRRHDYNLVFHREERHEKRIDFWTTIEKHTSFRNHLRAPLWPGKKD